MPAPGPDAPLSVSPEEARRLYGQSDLHASWAERITNILTLDTNATAAASVWTAEQVQERVAVATMAFEQLAYEIRQLERVCVFKGVQGGPAAPPTSPILGRRMALVRTHLETARLHAQEGVREVQELAF